MIDEDREHKNIKTKATKKLK